MATLEVYNLDQSIIMSALMSGLQKNDLKWSLAKTYPKDLVDMLARAEKYAQMEEAFMQEEISATSILEGGKKM